MKTKLFLTKIILLLCIVFSFVSCTVLKLKTHTTKTSEIYGLGIIQRPVVVDLDVKETKVSGMANSATKVENIEVIKNNAIYVALQNAKADVLVEPRFDTETTVNGTTVTVTGYPANYKNFRPASVNDTTFLKLGSSQTASAYEPVPITNKKGAAAAVSGLVGGILLLVLLLTGI